MSHPIVYLAGIGLIAFACQWVAWRTRLPAIVLLLLAGMTAGPFTGWLDPQALFGDLLFPFVSLSVAVILFEGSLTLKFGEIHSVAKVIRRLVSIGTLLVWLIAAAAAHWLVGFGWQLAMLFGAIMTVTGPTVIGPLIRALRPTPKVANVLKWEGILVDPIGAILAILVYEFIASQTIGGAIGATLSVFSVTVFTGVAMGVLAGWGLGFLLKRHLIPDYLHNMATLMLVFGVFMFSDIVQQESGLLTVTVMGVWLANTRGVNTDDILDFKESLSVVLISGLFILLAARVDLAQLQALSWPALAVLATIQFVGRPLKIWLSTIGTGLNWREKVFLSWIGPRGIVAAAVSALFALKLDELGYGQAELLVPLSFIVIIGTVVFQSLTAAPLARVLKVAQPDPQGFLIIGANPVARLVGNTLKRNGIDVILADRYWYNISKARMDGIPTYYGDPMSNHAERNLDLTNIGRMLALTPQTDLRDLSSLHYRDQFGSAGVFVLPAGENVENDRNERISLNQSIRTLFGDHATYSKLADWVSEGAEIRKTKLSESFNYSDLRKHYGDKAIPMFAFDLKGDLQVITADARLKPEAGWTVFSLIRHGTAIRGRDREQPPAANGGAQPNSARLPG